MGGDSDSHESSSVAARMTGPLAMLSTRGRANDSLTTEKKMEKTHNDNNRNKNYRRSSINSVTSARTFELSGTQGNLSSAAAIKSVPTETSSSTSLACIRLQRKLLKSDATA